MPKSYYHPTTSAQSLDFSSYLSSDLSKVKSICTTLSTTNPPDHAPAGDPFLRQLLHVSARGSLRRQPTSLCQYILRKQATSARIEGSSWDRHFYSRILVAPRRHTSCNQVLHCGLVPIRFFIVLPQKQSQPPRHPDHSNGCRNWKRGLERQPQLYPQSLNIFPGDIC
jgi:hypothetical protein